MKRKESPSLQRGEYVKVAQQAELLEAVKNVDWDALPPSVLLKVQELVQKHWAKK